MICNNKISLLGIGLNPCLKTKGQVNGFMNLSKKHFITDIV